MVIAALSIALAGVPVVAQQPAGNPGAAMRTFASSAEVAALVDKARSERKEGQPLVALPILRLAPYNANLEYRASVGTASVHEREAELFYVIDGSATLITGGTLKNEQRTNAANRSGSGIEGGTSQRIGKGDFFIVPENTAHWFSTIDDVLTLMSLHVPRPVTP
jgi:mannose-6-phosphate isomerase-like protein (cupin superfamily)